ncbi:S-methyl-5-thioribose-1-phosphate isomerase [Cytobacillus kochii]|uniref:S-methyl-5-thioribose-1-phosphate isomerase n=1 Tax=Cytobacillus kochii TaxID=859143 RepID=UPI0025A169AB|nr:S-methyl-5-thioribose-1-phosphate isomerase [Cytobacillus kochii]MDM5206539.1 S-methyl-5-thioribose-1-phosphate isomerase [Cytobacillus kochii]
MSIPTPIEWQDGRLKILDQTLLPHQTRWVELETIEDVFEAIIQLRVRGAPAIGITAAYGLAIAAKKYEGVDIETFHLRIHEDYLYLAGSRPTAVNLFWALDRMMKVIETLYSTEETIISLEQEAKQIHQEDEEICRQIGENALSLLNGRKKVLTICNAGTIATGKYGTALAPFHLGKEKGVDFQVYACETRPVLQGARLTAWELQQSNVDVTVITDNMAAHTIATKGIEAIIVGADRIASNGDTANKIGTWQLAILANYFQIPFYVAAPLSTFDFSIVSGADIPIEERLPEEVTHLGPNQITPEGTKVLNPAFDVTTANLITAIITEKGIFEADRNKLAQLNKAEEGVRA